jgi:uncharacterized membrane protein
VHGSFVGISKTAGRSGGGVKIAKKAKSNPKETPEAVRIDLSALSQDEDVQKAAKRVLTLQSEIETATKRMKVMKSQLATLLDKLKLAENLANGARKQPRKPSKSKAKTRKKEVA